MRIACRKFLNQYANENNKVHFYLHNYDCISSWKFNSTLGELRGTFGIMLAQMAVAYGIDIENELASILPEKIARNNVPRRLFFIPYQMA